MNSENSSAELPSRIWERPDLLLEFNRLVLEDFGPETIEIGCVVTDAYVFDFVIFYESLLNSWTFYPFRVHAFVVQGEAYETLRALELPHVEVRLLPASETGSVAGFASGAAACCRRSERGWPVCAMRLV